MMTDPYYQQRKCSPGIAVSRKVRFMRIFAKESESGVVENWQLSLLSLAIFRTFTSKATIIILY